MKLILCISKIDFVFHCFDAVIWALQPDKIVPDVSGVSDAMLNLTHSTFC